MRRGISPVIATVILVAITIAVAIAVAFWMTGIVGIFAGAVEKLEITSIYAIPSSDKWEVKIRVNNTGTTAATIDMILVNNVNIKDCESIKIESIDPGGDSNLPVSINPGEGKVITLSITKKGTCGATTLNPGVSIEVKLHSATGKEYPKLITLP